MKLIAKIFGVIGSIILFASCGSKQQPGDRVHIIPDNDTTACSYVAYTPTDGGHAEVKVTLNDVPFKMLWDTGCTTTMISLHELKSLAKHDAISMDDYEGVAHACIADGSVVENVSFNIETLEIPRTDGGSFTLHNVSVLVSPSETAGMLLGQNVMQELPRHKFDESKGLIQFDGK